MAGADIVVGRIARAHGLRGQLVIQPASPGSDVLLQLDQVALEQAGRRSTLQIRDARWQGKLILLAFEGYPDRTAAEPLIGGMLSIRADQLPPPGDDEVYASTLVGFAVISPAGKEYGRVAEVESAGAMSWLVVETPSGQRLVPFTEPLVKVQASQRRIVVDAPDGLLEGAPE